MPSNFIALLHYGKFPDSPGWDTKRVPSQDPHPGGGNGATHAVNGLAGISPEGGRVVRVGGESEHITCKCSKDEKRCLF